eukprot:8303118-Prorocentrum_lima.AAC.1
MTSSLVGSEMCIRDSPKTCLLVQLGEGRQRVGQQLQMPACLSLSVGLGAVSYTHLTLPTICSV